MFRRLALGCGALLLVLGIGEILARVWFAPPRYHNEPLQLDPELGFRGVSDFRGTRSDARGEYTVELSSDGLRGSGTLALLHELRDSAEPGELRVVFLGDSFLFTLDRRDADLMTARTAVALAERGIPAEVANLSASDYGTAQELLLLRRLAPRLRPDVVVLALYPGNDLINNALGLAGSSRVSVGDYVRPYLIADSGRMGVRWTHPWRAWLRRHSRLFAVAERNLLARAGEQRIDWLQPWPSPAGVAERLGRGAAPREHLELFRRPAPGSPWQAAWGDTFALLRAVRDEAEALGARLLVLVIPMADQVHTTAKGVALDASVRRALGRPLGALLDWNLPEERLGRFFAAEGMDARMLQEPLRAAAEAGTEVFERDGHLAPAGHALAAELVSAWLAGEPGTPPSDAPSRPVDRHPGGEAGPERLDFRAHAHPDFVGDGWIGWRSPKHGAAGGWELGRRGLFVLPDRAGELVVQGEVLADAVLPAVLSVEVAWGPRRRVPLDQPGPFTVRLPSRPENPPGAGDHVVVLVGQEGPLAEGVLVQEVGWESAAPDRGK